MSDNCGLPLYLDWGAPECDSLACKPYTRRSEEGVEVQPTVFWNFWWNCTMQFLYSAATCDTSLLRKKDYFRRLETHTYINRHIHSERLETRLECIYRFIEEAMRSPEEESSRCRNVVYPAWRCFKTMEKVLFLTVDVLSMWCHQWHELITHWRHETCLFFMPLNFHI